MDCGAEGQQLWSALCSCGLTGKKLAVFEATDSGDIAAEPMQKRLRGEHTMDPLHLQDWELQRAIQGLPSASGLRAEADDGWMPRPLTLSMRPKEGDQARACQEQEDELRAKWATELYNELKAIRAPALQELELCVDRSRLPAALAGRTRASTLRRYVKTWRDWMRWLEGSKGGWDHSSAGAFCEYLFHRFDEPCGPTFLLSSSRRSLGSRRRRCFPSGPAWPTRRWSMG